MKIVLLGANGRTGLEVLHGALKAGDSVTALVRNADHMKDITHDRLKLIVGDVCDSKFLESALSGHDLVISTLGPRKPTKSACRIYSNSAKSIVAAMKKCELSRLMVTSTALLFPSNRISDRFFRLVARNNFKEAGLMESHIKDSGLDWTFARTGFLTNKNNDEYMSTSNEFPEAGGSISRAALANFLLSEARDSNYIKQAVGLCEMHAQDMSKGKK